MPSPSTLAKKGKKALQAMAADAGIDPDQTVTKLAAELAAIMNAAEENTGTPEPIPSSAEEAEAMGITPAASAAEPEDDGVSDDEVLSVMEEQARDEAVARKAAKVIFKLGTRVYTYGELLTMRENPDEANLALFDDFLDHLEVYVSTNTPEKARLQVLISGTRKFRTRIGGEW